MFWHYSHRYDVAKKSRHESRKYGRHKIYQTYEYRIDVKILSESSTHSRKDLILCASVESFCHAGSITKLHLINHVFVLDHELPELLLGVTIQHTIWVKRDRRLGHIKH